jgi:hypothetical protein
MYQSRKDPFVERELRFARGRQKRQELWAGPGLPREDGEGVAGLLQRDRHKWFTDLIENAC